MPKKGRRKKPIKTHGLGYGKPKVCRVCLDSRSEEMQSLFDPYKNGPIFQHIVAFVNVKIRPDDGLPDQICQPCFLELETVINFKEKCENSDQKLLQNAFDYMPAMIEVKKEEPEEYLDFSYLENDTDQFYIDDVEDKSLLVELDTTREIKNEATNNVAEISNIVYKQVECHDCRELFKSKCKLRVHWKKTHKPKSYTCEICRRVFKSVLAYNKHKKIKGRNCISVLEDGIRVEGEGKSRVFYCVFCDYQSSKIENMRAHTVTHSKIRRYACNLCPKRYSQTGSLLSHKENAHGQYRVEMTCSFCGMFVKGRQRIYRHLQLHSAQRYQCDLCKKILKTRRNLIIHLKRHGTKSVTCEQCGEAFYTTAELCNHKRKHKVKEHTLIQCKFCAYKAKTKKSVDKHQIKHTDCNFPCVTCGMFFESQQKVNLHEPVHLAEKKFECPMCDSRFRLRKYLVIHTLRLHKRKLNQVTVKQEPEGTSHILI